MKPLTRAERRRLERTEQKITNKTYTYDEVAKIVTAALKNQEREYDIMYAVLLANVLAAEPLNFGNLRVCRVVNDFFGQVDAMHKKLLDLDYLKIEAAKLGVLLKDRGDGLEVYIDPKYKYKEGDIKDEQRGTRF